MHTLTGKIFSCFKNDEEKRIARCTICKRNFKNNRVHNLKRHLVKSHLINDIPSKSKETLTSVTKG